MKTYMNKSIAFILSFVLLFGGVFTLMASAEEYVDFRYASEPYDENVIYYDEFSTLFYTTRVYFKIRYLDTLNTQNAVVARIYLDDLSDEEKNRCYDEIANNYPHATYLSPATNRYNCHSYAWYSPNVHTNEYWISDPKSFYEDHSYCTVSTPQVGDIICYFDDMGTESRSDDQNIHSGIVTGVLTGTSNNICGTADLVTVTSKWGSYGLYSHNGLYCPYTSNNGGAADYVKYFRSEHNYRISFLNGEQHILTCISCNYTLCLPHQYTTSQNLFNGYHGLSCECGFDKGEIEPHYTHHYISINNFYHYRSCECGYLFEKETHDMQQIGMYNICRDCGCAVNIMTDITIKGVEDDIEVACQ